MCPVSSSYKPAPVFKQLKAFQTNDAYSDEVKPAKFPEIKERFFNLKWAHHLGLGELTGRERAGFFADFAPLPFNLEAPLALRYHGHQFRSYNPDLGDGRGFLYAQLLEEKNPYSPLGGPNPRLLDLGTKGSGTTPYSRRGDGRLTLKGAVREALATEMLESLGVYTSKTFSIYETGEKLERHDEPSPTRAAVLTRLSHSHLRFGTFQRLAFLGQKQAMQNLLSYTLKNYFPDLLELPTEEQPPAFLREVTSRSADLVASWLIAGFVHGVLNTDNMNVTGESFDYGPYRFLPTWDPGFTAAYFDNSGLYSFGRQPEAVLWNLEQLAQSLSLIAPPTGLASALESYGPTFNKQIASRFIDRLGLGKIGLGLAEQLMISAFEFLRVSQIGYEAFYFDWYGGQLSEARAMAGPRGATYSGAAFDAFKRDLTEVHAAKEPVAMDVVAVGSEVEVVGHRLQDPYFQRPEPCTLLIDEVEQIWDGIAQSDDWSAFEAKIKGIRQMGYLYGRRKI